MKYLESYFQKQQSSSQELLKGIEINQLSKRKAIISTETTGNLHAQIPFIGHEVIKSLKEIQTQNNVETNKEQNKSSQNTLNVFLFNLLQQQQIPQFMFKNSSFEGQDRSVNVYKSQSIKMFEFPKVPQLNSLQQQIESQSNGLQNIIPVIWLHSEIEKKELQKSLEVICKALGLQVFKDSLYLVVTSQGLEEKFFESISQSIYQITLQFNCQQLPNILEISSEKLQTAHKDLNCIIQNIITKIAFNPSKIIQDLNKQQANSSGIQVAPPYMSKKEIDSITNLYEKAKKSYVTSIPFAKLGYSFISLFRSINIGKQRIEFYISAQKLRDKQYVLLKIEQYRDLSSFINQQEFYKSTTKLAQSSKMSNQFMKQKFLLQMTNESMVIAIYEMEFPNIVYSDQFKTLDQAINEMKESGKKFSSEQIENLAYQILQSQLFLLSNNQQITLTCDSILVNGNLDRVIYLNQPFQLDFVEDQQFFILESKAKNYQYLPCFALKIMNSRKGTIDYQKFFIYQISIVLRNLIFLQDTNQCETEDLVFKNLVAKIEEEGSQLKHLSELFSLQNGKAKESSFLKEFVQRFRKFSQTVNEEAKSKLLSLISEIEEGKKGYQNSQTDTDKITLKRIKQKTVNSNQTTSTDTQTEEIQKVQKNVLSLKKKELKKIKMQQTKKVDKSQVQEQLKQTCEERIEFFQKIKKNQADQIDKIKEAIQELNNNGLLNSQECNTLLQYQQLQITKNLKLKQDAKDLFQTFQTNIKIAKQQYDQLQKNQNSKIIKGIIQDIIEQIDFQIFCKNQYESIKKQFGVSQNISLDVFIENWKIMMYYFIKQQARDFQLNIFQLSAFALFLERKALKDFTDQYTLVFSFASLIMIQLFSNINFDTHQIYQEISNFGGFSVLFNWYIYSLSSDKSTVQIKLHQVNKKYQEIMSKRRDFKAKNNLEDNIQYIYLIEKQIGMIQDETSNLQFTAKHLTQQVEEDMVWKIISNKSIQLIIQAIQFGNDIAFVQNNAQEHTTN